MPDQERPQSLPIERVIEVGDADINVRGLKELQASVEPLQRKSVQFVKRLIVITNQGIQVMKRLDKVDQCPRCGYRDPSCPTGPT